MEDLLFVIIMGLVGLLFLSFGYLIWIKEKINMIHEYHYTKVKETDKKAYTSIMGKAMVVIGIGAILSGIVDIFIHSVKSGIAFGICFVLGAGMMIYAQTKYNHGIF